MKQLFLAALLFACSSATFAQKQREPAKGHKQTFYAIPDDPYCSTLQDIVALSQAKKLVSIAGDSTNSFYLKEMFGSKMYASSICLPGALQCIIEKDPAYGTNFHAFLKDYSIDEAAAKKDFLRLSAKYKACFPKGKVKTSPLELYINLKDCQVELHTFESGFTGTWVASVAVRMTEE